MHSLHRDGNEARQGTGDLVSRAEPRLGRVVFSLQLALIRKRFTDAAVPPFPFTRPPRRAFHDRAARPAFLFKYPNAFLSAIPLLFPSPATAGTARIVSSPRGILPDAA
jgi:hypothetical protein